MIVYTVQRLETYYELREQGYLHGHLKNAMHPEAYEWMMQQMAKRLPNYKGDVPPIWVWQRRVNRNEHSLFKKGTKGVILTLNVPDEDIVWSSFDEWHAVLNKWPIVINDEEEERFKTIPRSSKEVAATWERVFDLDLLMNRTCEDCLKEHWLQGVTPQITMDQVVKVTRFIAR